MTRTRHILAVTLVATALCADRSIASASAAVEREARPASTGVISSITSKLVRRLSSEYRRAVPAMRLNYAGPTQATRSSSPVEPTIAPLAAHQPISASEFRLPPPSL